MTWLDTIKVTQAKLQKTNHPFNDIKFSEGNWFGQVTWHDQVAQAKLQKTNHPFKDIKLSHIPLLSFKTKSMLKAQNFVFNGWLDPTGPKDRWRGE
jgi:hypothetical protein